MSKDSELAEGCVLWKSLARSNAILTFPLASSWRIANRSSSIIVLADPGSAFGSGFNFGCIAGNLFQGSSLLWFNPKDLSPWLAGKSWASRLIGMKKTQSLDVWCYLRYLFPCYSFRTWLKRHLHPNLRHRSGHRNRSPADLVCLRSAIQAQMLWPRCSSRICPCPKGVGR